MINIIYSIALAVIAIILVASSFLEFYLKDTVILICAVICGLAALRELSKAKKKGQ